MRRLLQTLKDEARRFGGVHRVHVCYDNINWNIRSSFKSIAPGTSPVRGGTGRLKNRLGHSCWRRNNRNVSRLACLRVMPRWGEAHDGFLVLTKTCGAIFVELAHESLRKQVVTSHAWEAWIVAWINRLSPLRCNTCQFIIHRSRWADSSQEPGATTNDHPPERLRWYATSALRHQNVKAFNRTLLLVSNDAIKADGIIRARESTMQVDYGISRREILENLILNSMQHRG